MNSEKNAWYCLVPKVNTAFPAFQKLLPVVLMIVKKYHLYRK
jgi:hypothetical protein